MLAPQKRQNRSGQVRSGQIRGAEVQKEGSTAEFCVGREAMLQDGPGGLNVMQPQDNRDHPWS